MSRVKSMREEKNQKKLLQEYNKRKELAKLRDKHSPEFSNWRGNVTEGMNTGNVFFTTLPATGDTDLETISTEVSSSFEDAGGNDAFENTTVRGSGTGSGSDGGFNIGNHLAFQGDGQPRWAILKPIDSSKFDTLTISAIRGNDTNGGEDPDATGEELRLYYLPPGGSAFRSIGVNPEGQTVQPADFDVIIPLGSDNSGLRDYEIKLPSYARGAAFRYMLYQLTNSGTGFDNYGIKNVRYQRKAPLSVFVPLDSPEAASFINDGSGGLSPEEKKKRLEDMLAASDEYQSRQFPFNKAAYEQAAKDVARNIQISLDPSTFDVPTYGSPTYNQMFNARIEPGVGDAEIENALEREGLTLDTLEKGVVKNKGQFKMGREATLTLINNPYTQEKALTALGIDMSLVNNLTPDSFNKIGKITNLAPGGTPATGWDGKFYSYGDPNLERSRIIPLETYLQVKGTDNYAGVERPDTVEPGHRYVMEKKYSFTPDSEAEPSYTGVRNKDIHDKITNDMMTRAYGGSVGGAMWDYRLYKSGMDYGDGVPLKPGNKSFLADAAASAARAINYQYEIADLLAFEYLYDARYFSGIYTDRVEQNKDRDLSTEYNPLYLWSEAPQYAEMLETMRGLTSGRQLDMPVSYYTNNAQSAESKASEERYHKAKNDRIVADLQAAFEKIDSINNIYAFEKDEWYLKNDDQTRFVTEIKKVHPYSGLPEPGLTPEEPTPEEPQEPTEPETDEKLPEVQINAFSDGLALKELTIDDFEKAADFSAFKNGGGNAKLKQGYTLEQVIELGKKNIDGYDGGSPPRTAPVEYDTNNVISTLKSAANVISDNKELTSLLAIAGTIKAIGAGSLVLTTGAIASSSYAIAAVTAPEVTDARMYQTQLLAKLTGSIVSGKSAEVKIGDRGIQDMVSSINPTGFESAIQIGSAPKPNEQNAIKPTPFMKKDDVLSGSWNDIGAVEVHVNPRTKAVTITSNKMLRTGQPGDKFENALVSDGVVLSPGTQTKFGDIPVLSPDQIQQGLDRFNLRKPLENLFKTVQLVDKRPGDRMNSFASIASLMIDMAANGTASNAVKLRRFFTDRGAKKSEMEMQDAGYGHTFSQTEIPFNKLPIEIRNVINNKLGKETLGGGSLGDTLQGTGAGDAATAAADTQRKKKKNVKEMYEPKAKHNDKVAKVTGRLKSVSDFLNHPDVKPVFPKNPPPEMINGRHPDLVDGEKVSNRFNRLDPISAKSMPKTGNPKIDAKVAKAKKKLKTFENFDNPNKKKFYEKIATQETKYLRYFVENFSVPKYYDWESGEFNELAEINKVVLKRLGTIEDALSEGMTTKVFKYLYGGVVTHDIVSLNPNSVSSTFAHDLISASSQVTSHMFGPDFPGSHINSIGDFKPQSYSKVDVLATASWNSIQDVTPSGWTPENSYDYIDSVSDVVSSGQETDIFKDTHFGEVTVDGTSISLSTGDDEDSSQENTVDIEDLKTLFPGVTFPTANPMPGETDREDPIEASMLLRTFKSIKVGEKISFNYSFTSLETEEGDDVTYRGETREPAGDDNNLDDYAFVLIAGRVQKIVSVMARDGNNIDFNFQANGSGNYKPDILQSRFPLTGKYSYTVTQDDIDDHGNLKLFVGVMDSGDSNYESNLDITDFELSRLDSSRLAAGQLGQTTDAYDLGYRAQTPEELRKLLQSPEVASAIEKLGTQAKTYIDYLTGNLPDTIDNEYLGQKYVNSIFKDAVVNNKGKISVGDNVVGTGGEATYDPKTGQITIPFNYDFNTNAQEIAKNPERFGNSAFDKTVRAIATMLGGDYALDSLPVVPAGYATALSKLLGGAKHKPGKVTMSADKVNKLNPLLHAQVVGTTGLAKEELYPGQPSPNGFPDTPPPKMINGRHPDLVDGKKVSNRFNRLDPISAKAMPKTGNPKIDAKVAKALKRPK